MRGCRHRRAPGRRVTSDTPVAVQVGQLRPSAACRLRASAVSSPESDVEVLLAHVLACSRAQLRHSKSLTSEQLAQFETLLELRCQRVPLQHLTGVAGFRYLDIQVGPGVFIPRPETEVLVELAIAAVSRGLAPSESERRTPRERARIVDLCTGSAAVALSLATELTGVDVWAVEKDPDARSWAHRNLAANQQRVEHSGSSVRLVLGDVTDIAAMSQLALAIGPADVVVSNPPYIPAGAVPCDPEVRDHDPAIALYGGADGLDVIRGILDTAAAMLRRGGVLLIEHGDRQGESGPDSSLPQLIRADRRYGTVADHRDLSGRPRVATAVLVDA